NHLGRFYRRIRAKLGGPQAVTATAHKLARIFYHMVTTQQEYDETLFERCDQRQQAHHLASIRRQAKNLGFSLEPIQVT
ncbi:MAG TPA: IS110 family transposase, partial [Armatimonadota bacterium]|nr:IS110 family transposase [Armatimonadota bacterium]